MDKQTRFCGVVNWTEDGITAELLAAGVPSEDIVLAFHPPHLRSLIDFAAV